LRMTVLTGLMLGCDIAPICKFDRKNYFYPDMSKNYQISQYETPLCTNGAVPLHDLAYPKDAQKNIITPDKEVHLVRIHLEEDVAKSFHFENSTGIDFNRAGTPLMEIVTQPEINSPEEAFAFLSALKQILSYGGVSDADMEKGQLRCDCNVSVRPESQTELGAKIELKNLNSILNDLQNALGAAGKAINECPIPPEALDEFVNLIDSGKISGKQGKEVFADMFATGKTATAIVKEKGVEQLSDADAIEKLCIE